MQSSNQASAFKYALQGKMLLGSSLQYFPFWGSEKSIQMKSQQRVGEQDIGQNTASRLRSKFLFQRDGCNA